MQDNIKGYLNLILFIRTVFMKKIFVLVSIAVFMTMFGAKANAKDVNISGVVGYEHKPTIATQDYTLSLNKKLTNTHSIGGFGKYRYSETDNHAYQGLLGVFVNRTLDKNTSLNSSYVFVQIYGLNKADIDRFSFSYNRTYHKTKTTTYKFTGSYSTQTDFTEGNSVSGKNTLLVKTDNKKLSMTFAHSISYDLDVGKMNLNKLDWQVRYSTGKKTSVSLKYSNLSYNHPRTDSDDVVNLSFSASL